jgi:hypothetical protein
LFEEALFKSDSNGSRLATGAFSGAGFAAAFSAGGFAGDLVADFAGAFEGAFGGAGFAACAARFDGEGLAGALPFAGAAGAP